MGRVGLAFTIVIAAARIGCAQQSAEKAPPPPHGGSQAIAVVSLANFNTWLDRTRYVGRLPGSPTLGPLNNLLVGLLLTTVGGQGLDKTRPWGIVFEVDEAKLARPDQDFTDCLTGYGFVPFDDFPTFREYIEGTGATFKDLGGGILQFVQHDRALYVKPAGKWAYFALTREALNRVAPEPEKMLGDLPRQYDLAMRVDVAHFPEPLRRRAIEAFKGVTTKTAGETNAGAATKDAFEKVFNDYASAVMARLVAETDSLTIGGAIKEHGKIFCDVNLTARPGTMLHDKLTKWELRPNSFAGFVAPDADASFAASFRFVPPSRADLDAGMKSLRDFILDGHKMEKLDPQELALGKETMDTTLGMFERVWAGGRIEVGMSGWGLKQHNSRLMVGISVPGADQLDKLLRDAYAAAGKNPPVKWQPDADRIGKIRLHALTVPADPGDPAKFQRMAIGTSPDALYLADGDEPVAALKAAIERSKRASKDKSPPRIALDLRSLLKDDHPEAAEILRAGQGHLFFSFQPISNGMGLRIEVEGIDAVLQSQQ